jgi:Mg2+/Co2+ transporter CorB
MIWLMVMPLMMAMVYPRDFVRWCVLFPIHCILHLCLELCYLLTVIVGAVASIFAFLLTQLGKLYDRNY